MNLKNSLVKCRPLFSEAKKSSPIISKLSGDIDHISWKQLLISYTPYAAGTVISCNHSFRHGPSRGFTVSLSKHYNRPSRPVASWLKGFGISIPVSEMDHSHNSNFILVISSHGESGQAEDHNTMNRDFITAVNGGRVFYDKITSYFTETACPSLKNKPKLFFIQVLFRRWTHVFYACDHTQYNMFTEYYHITCTWGPHH